MELDQRTMGLWLILESQCSMELWSKKRLWNSVALL